VAGALPAEPANLRRCSCQTLKPSRGLRLYEYLAPRVSMSTVANGEAEREFDDMRICLYSPRVDGANIAAAGAQA
jgi:hypothetical protein